MQRSLIFNLIKIYLSKIKGNRLNYLHQFLCNISKFMIQSINAHPDFSAATWTLNILPAGTDDVASESGQTLEAVSLQTVTLQSFTNNSVIYVPSTSSTSDVNLLTYNQSLSVVESNISKVVPDLPWSIAGTTSISFKISSYISVVPAWIAISSLTGELTISAPEVSANTIYYFYVDSILSGVVSPIHKLIELTILNCAVSNWQKCISTNSSSWAIWNSAYSLDSGVWKIQKSASETAKSLSTTTIYTQGVLFGCVIFTSVLSASSVASLWMTINQLQIFFFILKDIIFWNNNICFIIMI